MATSVINHLRRAVLLRDGAGFGDDELLGCFIERKDEAALAALVKRHGPMVWGVCRRLLSHHDAEDAFQATFIVLVRKAASIVPRGMVGNWLYGVAHQTALQARRTAMRRRAREVQVTEMPEPENRSQGPEVRGQEWNDVRPLLDQELSRLPDNYRAVVVLCDLEGRTRKEVARQLGVPEGTVAGRLPRARAMLAKRLAQRGVNLSGGALAAVLAQQVGSAGVPASVVSSTISAASLTAAGHTAAAGVISSKVAALTQGVLKAMFMTQLKIATLVFLTLALTGIGIGMLALPAVAEQRGTNNAAVERPAKEKKTPNTDLENIEGTWTLVSQDLNGEQQDISSFKRQWSIKDGKATTNWAMRPDPNVPGDQGKKGSGNVVYTMDPAKTPKEITFIGDRLKLLMVYKLEKDTLTLGFFGRAETERPKGFSVDDAGLGAMNTKLLVEAFKREPPSAEEPRKAPPKDLGKIQPPGGVPLPLVKPGTNAIGVDELNKVKERLEAVPEKDLVQWVVELERIMDKKLPDGLPSARQACRTDFAIRLSVAFDDLKWNAKTADNLLKRAQTMPTTEAKVWKNAFEEVLKKEIGQTDTTILAGGPEWAVPLVLIPVDALHEGQKYSAERAKKYLARLKQLTAEDVSLWKDQVDEFGGTKLDAAVNIVLLDDFFDKERFQRDKFKTSIGATKK